MKVRNLRNTSGATCKCGSWLDHWKKYSGQTVTFCSEKSCTGKDLVGAHVAKTGDSTAYIVPLCNSHNQSTSDVDISDATRLVTASNPACR